MTCDVRYLYFYNFCYISNPAWYNFLFDGLNFSNWDVGVLTFIGSLMSVAGLYMYEHFFFQSAWRFLYIWTTFVSACFSMMQARALWFGGFLVRRPSLSRRRPYLSSHLSVVERRRPCVVCFLRSFRFVVRSLSSYASIVARRSLDASAVACRGSFGAGGRGGTCLASLEGGWRRVSRSPSEPRRIHSRVSGRAGGTLRV